MGGGKGESQGQGTETDVPLTHRIPYLHCPDWDDKARIHQALLSYSPKCASKDSRCLSRLSIVVTLL